MSKLEAIREALVEIRGKLVKGDTSAEAALEVLLQESKDIAFSEGEIRCYEYLGGIYRIKGNYEAALAVYKKGYELAKDSNDMKMLPIMINWLGSAYFFLGDYKKSFDLASESLVLFDKLKMYEKKSEVLINLGQRHSVLGNMEKAEQYLLQAVDLAKDLEDNSETWANYYSLAQYYEDVDQEEKCRENYKKSLDLAKKFNSEIGLIFNYEKQGGMLQKKGNYEEALKVLDKAFVLAQKNHVASSIVSINLIKASCYIKTQNLAQAQKLLLDIIKDERTDKRKLSIAHDYLHQVYLINKEFEKALVSYKNHIALEQELQSVETKKHIETTEAKYQNQLKENEKEILRLQKLEMEQKAIRAQLNPHFFFNALNSIQKFIVENDQERASSYLQSFAGLMRKTLENSEEIFIPLEDEISFLKDYLALEQLRCNDCFEFKFIVDEEIEEDFQKIPPMLLQPYVENAVKHGVSGLKDGVITITFELLEDASMLCIIQDNGNGIKEKKGLATHKSMATKLLNERVAALKDQFKLDFKIQTISQANTALHRTGTRVEVHIPNLEILNV